MFSGFSLLGSNKVGRQVNATDHCPVKPSVTLKGLPASLGAFRSAPFSWTLDNGTAPHAHSMLTSIRYSESSVADAWPRRFTTVAALRNQGTNVAIITPPAPWSVP